MYKTSHFSLCYGSQIYLMGIYELIIMFRIAFASKGEKCRAHKPMIRKFPSVEFYRHIFGDFSTVSCIEHWQKWNLLQKWVGLNESFWASLLVKSLCSTVPFTVTRVPKFTLVSLFQKKRGSKFLSGITKFCVVDMCPATLPSSLVSRNVKVVVCSGTMSYCNIFATDPFPSG